MIVSGSAGKESALTGFIEAKPFGEAGVNTRYEYGDKIL